MDFSELFTVSNRSPKEMRVTYVELVSCSVSEGMSGIVAEFVNFVIRY